MKDVVREHVRHHREMFVPLVHPPGNAQVDFGEAVVVVDGVEQKGHFLAMDLPHSDAPFVMIFPKESTEAFCLGHATAFAWFGGVPRTILYDNTAIAVARILDSGERKRTQVFDQLVSHYLFHDRFARVGKGNASGDIAIAVAAGIAADTRRCTTLRRSVRSGSSPAVLAEPIDHRRPASEWLRDSGRDDCCPDEPDGFDRGCRAAAVASPGLPLQAPLRLCRRAYTATIPAPSHVCDINPQF